MLKKSLRNIGASFENVGKTIAKEAPGIGKQIEGGVRFERDKLVHAAIAPELKAQQEKQQQLQNQLAQQQQAQQQQFDQMALNQQMQQQMLLMQQDMLRMQLLIQQLPLQQQQPMQQELLFKQQQIQQMQQMQLLIQQLPPQQQQQMLEQMQPQMLLIQQQLQQMQRSLMPQFPPQQQPAPMAMPAPEPEQRPMPQPHLEVKIEREGKELAERDAALADEDLAVAVARSLVDAWRKQGQYGQTEPQLAEKGVELAVSKIEELYPECPRGQKIQKIRPLAKRIVPRVKETTLDSAIGRVVMDPNSTFNRANPHDAENAARQQPADLAVENRGLNDNGRHPINWDHEARQQPVDLAFANRALNGNGQDPINWDHEARQQPGDPVSQARMHQDAAMRVERAGRAAVVAREALAAQPRRAAPAPAAGLGVAQARVAQAPAEQGVKKERRNSL